MNYLAHVVTTPEDIAVVMRIIENIGTGETLYRSCKDMRFPVLRFNRIVKANAELTELLEEALSTGYDILADKLVDGNSEISTDPQMLGILSKNIQWFLTKRDKQRYGEHSVQEIHVSADRAIIEAMNAARQRVIDVAGLRPAPPVIDVEEAVIIDAPRSNTAMLVLSEDEELELASILGAK